MFLNKFSREKTGTRVCQTVDVNIVCAGMFLKEELKAWSVVIVCERTHYWVIWASQQGLQIKEDGFNTLIPEAQGACWISGLNDEELSVVLVWKMNQLYQIFSRKIEKKKICFPGLWLACESQTFCNTGKSTSPGRLKGKSSCSARLPSVFPHMYYLWLFSDPRFSAETIILWAVNLNEKNRPDIFVQAHHKGQMFQGPKQC